MKFSEILLESKLITQEDLRRARKLKEEKKILLGEALVQLGAITQEQMARAVAQELKVEYVDLSTYEISEEATRLIPERLARQYSILPLATKEDKILIAMTNPLDIIAIQNVKLYTGKSVSRVMTTQNELDNAYTRVYNVSEDVEKAITEFGESRNKQVEDVIEESSDVINAPVVRLVKSIILDAIKLKTSDIHIEPFEHRVRVRFRVDGELKEVLTLDKGVHNGIVTRIKIIGGMDISERRIPQDGRVETSLDGRVVDMRISILPTVYGEKIVIRLLDRNSIVVSKEQLGFTKENLALFDKIIKVPEGIILLTGPTGSGKTTTLYAVLKELNSINKNIITLEDPVEYRLDGVNQVQVNKKAGMTFAGGLRSILRQDPDVVMLGEIRDEETAEIAIRAAITGHVVLSTLHTNDTASTISRLVDMGIEQYMVSSAVVGIVAQRLIKKICPKCGYEYPSTPEEMNLLGISKPIILRKGAGCNYCNGSGYSGRTGIHEILVVDRKIKTMINQRESIDRIKQAARENGMSTLSESAAKLVKNGVTTIEQMLKVTYSVDE
ncbi:GspE/PulE family protein [Filifactor villosus]|uniref:GspE/PulE family protein n=1 Tax=Filifactor villosus TaxID=29374 RepID=A0ABV9QJ18_9FIRM